MHTTILALTLSRIDKIATLSNSGCTRNQEPTTVPLRRVNQNSHAQARAGLGQDVARQDSQV